MGVFSKLTTSYVNFGEKKSNPRKNKITRITPHHTAGTATATATAKGHRDTARQASANYYISDDSIVGGVSEDRRAWTTGTGNQPNTNDHMAITFEVSNDKLGDPRSGKGWTISQKSYRSLVRLCADICTRYGIKPYYKGKTGTITIHKDFNPTACPGEMLENLIKSGQFEKDILAEMGGAPAPEPTPQPTGVVFRVQIGAFKTSSAAEKFAAEFKKNKGLSYTIKHEGLYYKVQHPENGFTSKGDAELSRGALIQKGYKGAFIVAGN